ncbi:hypothetical protein Micbo1qcDRAFT_178978 [Microdochium bolleyi]|uniref:Uncharacterized protein n=1 Tax=Microdochium bolleyi TaxID=196109 RepID=A0A136IRD2_9PEZI|nr:hypothetical protein Micbo1qcDRAFT_178978 [Microdochium bolleyi]
MGAGGPPLGKSMKTTARGSSNSGRTWSGLLLVLLLLSLQVLTPGLGMINQHNHDNHHLFDDLIHESYDMLLRGFTSSAVAHERTLRPEMTKHEDIERFLGNELESLLDRSFSSSTSSAPSDPYHITALRQPRQSSTVINDKDNWLVDAVRGKPHNSDGQLFNDQSILAIPPVTSDSPYDSAATTARKQMERITDRTARDNSRHILVLQPSTSCADNDEPRLPTTSDA